jgi:CubicO group peptidase (beta-lactamase class C family)
MDGNLLSQAEADASAIPRLRSLLVARHGKLVLEDYFGGSSPETLFDVRSVTKSVVSALVGQALADGRLPSIDTTLGGYLSPPYHLSPGAQAITVRDLLTMTSGFEWNEETGNDYNVWIEAPDHIQFLLDRPQTEPPGPFTYNSAAVHLLGVVLQLASRQPLPSLADERLFRPAGITLAQWEALEHGTFNGGSGLELRAQDLLRLGQLMLQEGRSGSEQVVPADWVTQMTQPRFPWRDNDGAQESVTYGFLWWVADPPTTASYFAWGYGGQFVYVVPSLDLVIVTTTEWRQLSRDGLTALGLAESVLGIVVRDILPAARAGE